MGDYNPHRPRILGNEWVPIKDQPYIVNVDQEAGHLFTIDTAAAVVSGGIHTANVTRTIFRYITVDVYPDARIGSVSGPVQQVVVPVNGGTLFGSAALIAASTVAEALADPSDASSIDVPADLASETNGIDCNFNFNAFPELANKRILRLDVLYHAEVAAVSPSDTTVDKFLSLGGQLPRISFLEGTLFSTALGLAIPESLSADSKVMLPVQSLSTGPIDAFHNKFETDKVIVYYPWIYPNLQLFEPGTPSGTRMSVRMSNAVLVPAVTLWKVRLNYLTLRVTYCEETRIATGSLLSFGMSSTRLFPLRSLPTLGTAINLNPGSYAVVASESPFSGSIFGAVQVGSPVQLNAVRQLGPLPAHRGVLINRTSTAGGQFETVDTDRMVQVTLHTASGAVTGCHVYGTQIAAPVDGGTTAVQEIDRAGAPAAATFYPQARFYARRFGITNINLRLAGLDQTPAPAATITPAAFDALPELVDGWREVTLRFDAPTPSFAGPSGVVRWEWSAAGLAAADRWEVLAADAPAPTGGPGNLDPATYLSPAGGSANLTWRGVSDPSADATLMFAQDPPLVTGFALSAQTQPVTGFGLHCGLPPECVVTGIGFHRLSWSAVGDAGCDTFSRVVSGGWGTADTGQAWTVSGTTGEYSVDGERGVILLPTGSGGSRNAVLPDSYTDVDVRTTMRVSAIATGAPLVGYIRLRLQDNNNNYRLALAFETDGNVDLVIAKIVAGAGTTLVSAANVVTYAANSDVHARIQAFGTSLRGKVWTGATEPPAWTLTTTDTTYTSGQVGVRAVQSAGNTNTDPTVSFDNFQAVPLDLVGATLELQRSDDVDPTWRTIMASGSVCPVGFDDYEARVAVQSRYRLRVCDVAGFCGPWSAEVAATLTAPGVTGAVDNSVLIFTSNVCPARNLAYAMGWEGSIVEDFTFPEAADVTLQAVYRRDFVAAFHGTERGGERFSRTVLVQAAAVPAPSLAGVRSLRDLAWADLPYVCVRDELGNRWLANVQVPDVAVRRNRRLYLARIDITEVTVTPSPVDPGSVPCP